VNTEVVKKDPRLGTVRQLLEQLKPQMAMALPKHLDPERMNRIVLNQIQNNPFILDCDRGSLLASVMTACALGLEPDGVLGHGYLVPFKRKVQFIPGYKGYIKLARNSGEVSDLYAVEVREKDTYKVIHGLKRDLQHEKAKGDRGEIVGFYAVAHFTNGGFDFVDLTVEDINKVRDASEGYKAFKAGKIKDTPWESHYEAMGKKTAIRQLSKNLPMSVQRAAALEDQHDAGKHTVIEGNDLIISSELVDEQVKQETPEKPKAEAKLDKFAKVDKGKPGGDHTAEVNGTVKDGKIHVEGIKVTEEKPEPEFDGEGDA